MARRYKLAALVFRSCAIIIASLSNPATILVPASVGLFIIIAISRGAEESSGDKTPLFFKGKTSSEWIHQLRNSDHVPSRLQAAEVLGFMARNTSQTRGGFSDVPLDSPEPAKLADNIVQPIVDALADGLTDADARVRASSAVAISWIGPRAKSTASTLIGVLNDADDSVREKGISAIKSIGPPAKKATPPLERMLTKGNANRQIEIAGALRSIGASPDSYVPTLIKLLAQTESNGPAHYAALELAHLGDAAVPALKQAFKDKSPITRQNAAYAIGNMAGWGNLIKDRSDVANSLIGLAKGDNSDVTRTATQAIGSIHASPATCVPALVSLLKHKDLTVASIAAESLGKFGAEAKSSIPALVSLLAEGGDHDLGEITYAVRQIGIDRASAEKLCKLKLGDNGASLFMPLCEFPELAVGFLQANPEAIDVPGRDRDKLIRLMRNRESGFEKLREVLFENERLPPPVMAELGEASFLPLLRRKMKTASEYENFHLEACARACGEPPDRIVKISESQSGDFKPKSAWPNSDSRRRAADSLGHGDGVVEVIVTGTIVTADGKPAVSPKFYRINDSMLLGNRGREEAPIIFDAKTGRYVFLTNLFAAYSWGDGQRDPGPYQTGSALVVIEAEGCVPLQAQFYDEMPDVLLTLSRLTSSSMDN